MGTIADQLVALTICVNIWGGAITVLLVYLYLLIGKRQ